jgi:hypothetical protein
MFFSSRAQLSEEFHQVSFFRIPCAYLITVYEELDSYCILKGRPEKEGEYSNANPLFSLP